MPLPRHAVVGSLTLRLLLLALTTLLGSSIAEAQITNVTDTTSTPIPGAGHDYIHLLSETVSPSNGSVSVRIQVPMPKGRGITIPFSFAYDSNGIEHLVPAALGHALWLSNTGYVSQGGWSYSVPQLSLTTFGITEGSYPNYYTCNTYAEYMFFDPSGGRHALALGNSNDAGNYCPPGSSSGGDPQFAAQITSSGSTPVSVFGADGTVYTFAGTYHNILTANGQFTGIFALPSKIEDRNGNVVNVTDYGSGSFAFTDSVGRTAISSSGMGGNGATNTFTFSGLTYKVAWTTTSASYSVPATQIPDPGVTCTAPPAISGSQIVVSKITLPNGESYNFYYGNNPNPSFQNPYGLLSEIDYPTGGWVKYTWKLSDNANELADYPGGEPNGQGGQNPVQDGCIYHYQSPVVATREVGFGESTSPSQTQTFNYSTTWSTSAPALWTAKTTKVSTTDNVVGETALTAYAYSPIFAPAVPFVYTAYPGQIPVESSIQYYDWGNTTTPTRTVTKSWYDQYNLASQQTTLQDISPSVTSQITYCYVGTSCTPSKVLSQLQETDEYDFGASTPTRKTVTTYQSFSGAPGIIADSPCSTVVEDGSSNHLAETDYLYDGGATTCGASGTPSVSGVTGLIATTHDETYFGPSKTTPRGNPTKVTKLCIAPACSSGNSSTSYTYDETGQVLTKIDPCGNASCSDMSGTSHTTSYSYTDSYTTISGGSNIGYTPSGNTNAYLTKITNPLGQTQNFTYDYNNGQLTVSKDLNNLTTTYVYNDSLSRPTLFSYPDGGSTSTAYNDTPPSPTVTTSKKINSTASITSVTVFDGLFHATETELTSDPQGTIFTATAYDGFGRAYTVSNPYRSGTDPTTSAGTTTYAYDGIGRKKTQTYPDSSVLQTTYCGPSTLVTDPVGKWRRSRVDGLGRLVEVDEPNTPGATVSSCPGQSDPIWITSYTNDALSNLTQIVQNGSHTRNFTYDSLSRLVCSSNPESNTALCTTPDPGTYTAGTTRYTYDANSNVATKEDARAINTSYGYEPLNREISRSYSNGDPTVTTSYDQSSCLVLSACQNVGHPTSITDSAGSEAWAYQVDLTNLRSVHANQRTTTSSPSNITKTSTYYFDLAGNLTSITYPTGRVVNYTFDAANRPATAADSANGITYAAAQSTPPSGCLTTGVCYTPQGTEYSAAIGKTSTFAGINFSETYNARLQPLEIKASSSAGSAFDTIYSFVDPITAKNAGHVYSITNNLNSSRSQSFTYDQVNRIVTAGTTATTGTYCWGYQYTYDAWANLTSQAGWSPNYNGCSEATMGSVVADGNNHISGFTYDASGNTQSDGTFAYLYDAESQIKSAAGVTYLYDGSGRRVSKSNGKLYWYGPGGEILAETDPIGNATSEYIFFSGKRVADIANGIQNGGFEQGLSGWTTWNNAQLINNPANAHSGNDYIDISAAAGGGASIASPYIAVHPGDQITFGGWVYLETGGTGSPGWWLSVDDANHNAFSWINASPTPGTGWTYQTATFTVPANCAFVFLYAQVYLPTATTTIRVDDGFLDVGPNYYVEDLLGTSRVMTLSSGTVCYDADFDPYGGEHPYTNNCPSANVYKFEGKERDTETGNDDFGARYYTSRFGRWLSADWSSVPVPVPYANLTNPQTLNLYAMVSDDPESFADLDGHCIPYCIVEVLDNPEVQAVAENVVGAVVAGAAAAYADSKGLFDKAADFIEAHPLESPDTAAMTHFYNVMHQENTSQTQPTQEQSTSAQPTQEQSTPSSKETGSYTNTHESGKTYSGKGDQARSQASGKRVEKKTGDKHTATDWKKSASDREAFKDESSRIDANGGAKSNNNHNKIESPGKKYTKQDNPN